MIEVSHLAHEKVKEYIRAHNLSETTVRILVVQNENGDPSLTVGLDAPQANDETFERNGITYLIDKDLLSRVESVHVDFKDHGYSPGFSMTLGRPLTRGPITLGDVSSDNCMS